MHQHESALNLHATLWPPIGYRARFVATENTTRTGLFRHIHEMDGTQSSQNNLEEEQSWRIHTYSFKNLL